MELQTCLFPEEQEDKPLSGHALRSLRKWTDRFDPQLSGVRPLNCTRQQQLIQHLSMNGVGVHAMWGLSPAIDVLWAAIETGVVPRDVAATGSTGEGGALSSGASDSEAGPLYVLLASPGDIRHVLKTISQRFRHSKRPIHVQYNVPDGARHALLLHMAMDWALPIRQRVNTWLEVYGNCMVQERTAQYISEQGQALINLVTEGASSLKGLLDFSHLKFRERDELQEIFRGWHPKAPVDIATLRDYRLRHLYADRYDFRDNLIDWDYQTMVRPVSGNIHYHHFKGWRNTGIAFEFGDQTYTNPNRTMVSYAQGRERGLSQLRLGFWVDVVNSPYFALGTACYAPDEYAKQLFDIHSRGTGTEQFRHTGVEMSVYNLLSFFHEMETREVYHMRQAHEIYSGLGVLAGEKLRNTEDKDTSDAKQEAAPATSAPAEEESDASTAAETKDEPAAAPVDVTPEEVARLQQKEAQAAAMQERLAEERRRAAVQRAKCVVETLRNVTVSFISGDLKQLFTKKRYRNLFHVAVFSSNAAHHLEDPDIKSLLAPSSLIIPELARNMVTLSAGQQEMFFLKVDTFCRHLGATLVGSNLTHSQDTFIDGGSAGLSRKATKPTEVPVVGDRKPEYILYRFDESLAASRSAAFAPIKAQRDAEEAKQRAAAEQRKAAEAAKALGRVPAQPLSATAGDASDAGVTESKTQ